MKIKKVFLTLISLLSLSACDIFGGRYSKPTPTFTLTLHSEFYDERNIKVNVDKMNNTYTIIDPDDEFVNEYLFIGYYTKENGKGTQVINHLGQYLRYNQKYETYDDVYAYYQPISSQNISCQSHTSKTKEKIGSNDSNNAEYRFKFPEDYNEDIPNGYQDYYKSAKLYQYTPEKLSFSFSAKIYSSQMSSADAIEISFDFVLGIREDSPTLNIYKKNYPANKSINNSQFIINTDEINLKAAIERNARLMISLRLINANLFANYSVDTVSYSMQADIVVGGN